MTAQHPTGHVVRVALLGVVLAAGAAVLWRAGLFDVDRLRSLTGEAGPAAPVVFVFTYAALTRFPLPKNVLSAVAGAVFGLAVGVALVWSAAVLGAVLAFVIARRVDATALDWATGRHRDRGHALLDRHGTQAVLWGRLVAVAPFTAVNYVAGMSSIRSRDYVLGTAVGILPGTVVYVAVGTFALARPDLLVWAGLALLLLLVAGGAVARRLGRGVQPDQSGQPGQHCTTEA